jgi:hypothetical protein
MMRIACLAQSGRQSNKDYDKSKKFQKHGFDGNEEN